nr:NACHT, LRR and PYD domains-containing protein 14 isoform X2 [Microcebus murinus]XP_012599674.1 NACHT, LRR and PYD domains-containing protein 14 isoform X2 [Microcebus murinus]
MMTESLSSSFFSDFGLLLYLEELNKEELNKFKSFLKEPMEPGHGLIPWTQVKKAGREDLANLMKKYYPGELAWNVTLKIFGKMNLTDLCKRAKGEINWKARSKGPEDAKAREAQEDQEAVLDDRTEYRIQVKEKFCMPWDKSPLLGKPEHQEVTQENRIFLEQLFDVDVRTGEQPQMVVLQGAAGVGKTTLVRKAMLDWAEGNLYQQRFAYVFYLNGKEINQLEEKSFAQLIAMDWPSTESPIEKIMSEPSSLLFIIDSFDELNFAFEEPEFALCEDWTQEHPVSFLMSSLLRRAMLPESSLLVTMRVTASKRLKPLLKSHYRYVELLGMSEDARKKYIYQFFEDEKLAMKAFSSLKNNEMLFGMCQVPLVCWVVCTCLKQQIEKGGDVTLTCQTTTALFTCYISSLFTLVDGHSPSLPSQAQLSSLCYLAAKGIWTMTHVFYTDDLRRHGLTKSGVSVFMDVNILQKDIENENCYLFAHLHVQEFFAAMFYMLEGNWVAGGYSFQPFEDMKLLLESKNYEDSHLTQMKYFLFGLLNEDRVKELEKTLNCKLSLKIKLKLLQCMEVLGNREYSQSQLEFLELFHCLYETQEEAFISQAMRYFPKVVINICGKSHLFVSSFCIKHCRGLRSVKLSVTVVCEKMVNRSLPAETWQRDGDRITHCWQDLYSVLHTNERLTELDLCHSNLDKLAMKIFCQELRHPKCKLQKLLLRSVTFPVNGFQGISSSLIHNQNLLHLDLTGSDVGDDGVKSLCETLKHPECKLQKLRLESCNLTVVCCLNISKALIRSQSLIFLNLSTNNLLDDGVILLCEALRHPKCYLQRLSLESCGLTAAGCEDLSLALISNKRLTHLCLADNALGDGGVKLMSDVLQHPGCTLRSLVLRRCHFTSLSSEHLSTCLLHNKSLVHLDLGSNWLQDDGAKLLCDAFRHPSCTLQDVELMGCVLTSACCLDLASVILSNPNLWSLDLGNNDLQDDGVKILCTALRHPDSNIQRLGLAYCGLTSLCCQDLFSTLSSNQKLMKMNLTQNTLGCEGIRKLCQVLRSPKCKLQVLGLCKEAFDVEAQGLLEDLGVSNPHLTIKPDCNDDNEEDGSWWRCF